MKSIKSVYLIFSLLLFVVLAACSQTPLQQPSEKSLFTDADLDKAKLIKSKEVLVTAKLEHDLPEGKSVNLPNADFSPLATLPGDGSQGFVVYIRHNPAAANPWNIIRFNQETDTKTVVYSGLRELDSVSVDASGNKVVFSGKDATAGADYEVYILDINAASTTQLTSNTFDDTNVSVSSDGNLIAYEDLRISSGLRSVRWYDGTTTVRLNSAVNDTMPSISGDGEFIAFIRTTATGTIQVRRYEIATATNTSIVSNTDVKEHPSVSDDGKKVAWVQTLTNGSDRLRIKDTISNVTTNIFDSTTGIEHAHLRSDGDYITYGLVTAGFTRVYLRDLVGNTAIQGGSGAFNTRGMFWAYAPVPLPANVIVVDKDATGNNDGTSWEDAYTKLQDALDCVNDGTTKTHCNGRTLAAGYNEIWVASGTYYPDEGVNKTANAVANSFTINKDGVKLYGGFDGVGAGGTGGAQETQRDQRDWDNNRVVLSGDLSQNDGANLVDPNSLHVVRMPNNFEALSTNTVLDGFEITAGLADGSGGSAEGAGLYCDSNLVNRYCEVTLQNLYIHKNQAPGDVGVQGEGGGMYFRRGRPALYNIILFNNTADNGGGMYLEDSHLGFSGRLARRIGFYTNDAAVVGGAIFSEDSQGTLDNSVFVKNTSFNGGGAMFIDFNFDANSRWNLYNNTFHDNDATLDGGAIYLISTGENSRILQVANSMFTNNDAGLDGNDVYATMDNAAAEVFFDTNRSSGASDLFDAGAGFITIVDLLTAGGSIYVDANGADNVLGTPDDNFLLQTGYAGVDAGKNNYGVGGEDFVGNTRMVDGDFNGSIIVDLGAYERQP
jgi:hypothetical protein